ncbi:HU family DNA-binding protein [Propionivibrio limicola]|uniref:HU family DNA-binding protein n=1 Tax=Propionivibrio limicola TaxID=167645 RepID=UPI0012910FCB|nr:HU family DNA-binding protein [Propionivibrio limicola]
MNKSELIDAIAGKAEISKADATKALDAFLDTIVETVAAGDAVNLIGFGAFKTSERAARQGKNPKTGEKLEIPAATVPKFAVGAGFKAAVAKK